MSSADPRGGGLRALLLALVAVGAVGLLVELLLLEHWLVRPQLIPLATLICILFATVLVWKRPNPRLLRVFRGVMIWTVLAGSAGIGFHLRDNLAFEREIAQEASPVSVLAEAVRGATPLLAPGSLLHLGLVGLAFTYKHPGLRRHLSHSTRNKEHP